MFLFYILAVTQNHGKSSYKTLSKNRFMDGGRGKEEFIQSIYRFPSQIHDL
jgi:hypothetical protein